MCKTHAAKICGCGARSVVIANVLLSLFACTLSAAADAPSASESITPSKTLQGGVSKRERVLESSEAGDLYKLAVAKLASGTKLTAEEYRSLNVGCIGLESDRTFFQNVAIVSIVYRDSPAAQAGLRKGDKLIDNEETDDAAREHPEIPRWKVTLGKAGTQKTIVVLRHDKPVPLTLTRMNIEDIAEKNIRIEWEQMVAKLGYAQEGVFEGVGKKPLAITDDSDTSGSDSKSGMDK